MWAKFCICVLRGRLATIIDNGSKESGILCYRSWIAKRERPDSPSTRISWNISLESAVHLITVGLNYPVHAFFLFSCQAASHYLSPAICIFSTVWPRNFTSKEIIIGEWYALLYVPQHCAKVLKNLRTFAYSSLSNHFCDFEINFES